MTNIISADYNGTQVFFQDDAYLNATAIAGYFNKKPIEWLRLPSTEEYINALCEKAKVGKSHFVRTIRGGSDLSQRGTWLHRRLAVPFARWLNVEFAIWCDEQIEQILINKNEPKQLALPNPTINREFKDVMMKILNYAMHYEQFQKSITSSEKEKRQKQIEFLFSEIPDGDSYLFVFRQEISQDIQKASDLLFALNLR